MRVCWTAITYMRGCKQQHTVWECVSLSGRDSLTEGVRSSDTLPEVVMQQRMFSGSAK